MKVCRGFFVVTCIFLLLFSFANNDALAACATDPVGIVGYPDLLLMDLPPDSPLSKPILNMQSSGQKAVIASGFSETKRAKEAQKLGAGQYVKKPYTIEKIGQAVIAELSK